MIRECQKCKEVCWASALGHIGCVQYLHKKYGDGNIYRYGGYQEISPRNLDINDVVTRKDNVDACTYAAERGHIECLKFLCENGYYCDEWTCARAAQNGHLQCLIYLHQNSCPWNVWTCARAAIYDNLDCLQFAHKNGCPWDMFTIIFAQRYNSKDCLEYASKHMNTNI